jgi:hypothetical protein
MGLGPLGNIREHVDTVNVFDTWQGSDGHGDAFPLAKARERAKLLVRKFNGKRAVLCGRNVARAFGVERLRGDLLFTFKKVNLYEQTVICAVAPHPSGVSMFWNNEENVRRAEAFFCALARQNS